MTGAKIYLLFFLVGCLFFLFPQPVTDSWAVGTLEVTVLTAAELGEGPRVL